MIQAIPPCSTLWTGLRFWAIALWVSLLAAPSLAVELRPGQDSIVLNPNLVYATDPSASLATMLERFQAGQFGPDPDVGMLKTNYAPEAWAAVNIRNATIDDGRAPDPYAVSLELPMVSEVDIYLIRSEGLTENLLTYSIFAPFDPGQHSATRLRSPVFQIAPGETVTLMVHFKYGPFQSFQLALETPQKMESAAFGAGIKLAAFYAFSLACMLFFIGFFVALKDWSSLLYALLYLWGLALIAFTDGLLFRFLYPNQPGLQSAVGFFILFALSGSGFLLAGHSFTSNGAPKLARTTRAFAFVALAGFLFSLASPGTYAAFLAYLLLGLMLITVMIGTGSQWKGQGTAHTVAVWLARLTVAAILGVLMLVITGWARDTIQPAQAIKLVYAAMLIATIVNFAAHVILIRRQHAQAVAAKVAALEEEAKRSQELLISEQNYSRARDLAQLRQRQLATASHDFRQPLASLRMTLDGLGDQVDPALRARLTEAFDYMETLSGTYLADTTDHVEADHDDTAVTPAPPEDETEPYALSLILQTVQQMFHDEAVSRGLRLRMTDSSAEVTTAPIVLMRITSNLVSNAIKHCPGGRVLIGVRRRTEGPEIWVCDTGPGMSPAELDEYRQEGRKGEQSDGHGLGLAVCFDLARDHGLDLGATSRPGKGTVFRLRAKPQPR